MKQKIIVSIGVIILAGGVAASAQNANPVLIDGYEQEKESMQGTVIFDDRMLLDQYVKKYELLPKEIIVEMVKDETLTPYKNAAAIKVFRDVHAKDLFLREQRIMEKVLLRKLNREDAPFVEVEIMHTLCKIDRYRYFKSMVPILIQKIDHYNTTVSELAYESLNDVIETGSNRPREARIVFNTLRKVLFLTRKRLVNVKEPSPQLSKKLKLLRWSIKVLGTQELQRLPKEVINLL